MLPAFSSALPKLSIAVLKAGNAIQGFGIAIHGFSVVILSFGNSVQGSGITILSFSIALLSFSNAIQSFGIALLKPGNAILNDEQTLPGAKSSRAEAGSVKSPSKIAPFSTDAGRYAARPGVLGAAAGACKSDVSHKHGENQTPTRVRAKRTGRRLYDA